MEVFESLFSSRQILFLNIAAIVLSGDSGLSVSSLASSSRLRVRVGGREGRSGGDAVLVFSPKSGLSHSSFLQSD